MTFAKTSAAALASLIWTMPLVAQPTAVAPVQPSPASECANPAGPDEVVICAERESSLYRLPPGPEGFDPRGTVPSVSREQNDLLGPGPGGIGSCSPVGPGGWTGCDLIRWRAAREQRAGISQEQPHALSVGPVTFGVIKR